MKSRIFNLISRKSAKLQHRWIFIGLVVVAALGFLTFQPESQGAGAQSCTPTASDVIFHYDFDESGGATAHNQNGVDHGTLKNDAAFTPGKFGNALHLDGNSYVETPDPKLDLSGDFTIEAWVYPNYNNGTIITNLAGGSNAPTGFELGLYGGQLAFFWGQGYCGFLVCTVFDFNHQVKAGEWTHIAVTVNRNQNEPVRFYVNGQEFVATSNSNYTGNIDAVKDVWIGNGFHFGNFDGSIDELKIYNRALTASELQIKAVDQCAISQGQMAAWFAFDQTGSPMLVDYTGGALGQKMPLNSPPSSVVPGWVGNAIQFDGQDDHIVVPDQNKLDFGTGDFSIEFWVKTPVPPPSNDYPVFLTTGAGDSGAAARHGLVPSQTVPLWPYSLMSLVDKRESGPYRGYHIALANGSPVLQLADGIGSEYSNYSSGLCLADDRWHHLAVTVRRNDKYGIRWYLDGKPSGQVHSSKGRNGSLANNSPLYIGRHSISNTGHFIGSLDELSLYSRMLSSAEIESIFHAGRRGKCK